MIELRCEHLSLGCILLYVLIMSRTYFIVNPHSVVAWMSRNLFFKASTESKVYGTTTGHESTTT